MKRDRTTIRRLSDDALSDAQSDALSDQRDALECLENELLSDLYAVLDDLSDAHDWLGDADQTWLDDDYDRCEFKVDRFGFDLLADC